MRNIKNFFGGLLLLAVWSEGIAETIAVMTAQNPDPKIQAVYGQQITDSISNITRNFKKFTLVERSQQANIAKELKFQNSSSLVDDKTAVGIGQQSGAQVVALSSFVPSSSSERNCDPKYGCSDRFNLSLNVNIRFVDVKTGAVIFAKQVPASSSGSEQANLLASALVDFERKFERELTLEFPNVGYIIKMNSSTEYMVDVGKSNGLAVDDSFIIYIEGEDIVHPVTKQIIKGDKKVIAEAVVVSVSEQSATIKTTQTPTSPIEIGVAKIQAKPKKKGFFESINDFTRGVTR